MKNLRNGVSSWAFSAFLSVSGLISSDAFAADYCWTDYSGPAYFTAARHHVYCQDGEHFIVANPSYKDGSTGLLERTVKALKEKGYDLLFAHRDGYSSTADDVFVKNIRSYRHYCKVVELENRSVLQCPKEDGVPGEIIEFSLVSENPATIQNFLRAKGYEKIETMPAPVKPLKLLSNRYEGHYRSLTLYGTGRDEELCDSRAEGLIPPFTMNCI
jgi:hypothetical protein